MKIIFMGTPEFALPALQAIIDSQHQLLHVFTRAPAKSGRGQQLQLSPVHNLANQHNVPVSYPKTLRDPEVQKQIKELGADLIIVAAYGMILPQAVLDICPYGCLNIHPSLLPRWRGAAPIERTVLAGDQETAVCIMQMDAGLDTGDILKIEHFKIPENTSSSQLSNSLSHIGAKLLIQTIDQIPNITKTKQAEQGITYAHKLEKTESLIDWNNSASEIECMVRAFDPWPGTFFQYQNELITIGSARVIKESPHKGKISEVVSDDLHIQCGSGILQPTSLQRPGKKLLSLNEFLRGNKIPKGTILSGS